MKKPRTYGLVRRSLLGEVYPPKAAPEATRGGFTLGIPAITNLMKSGGLNAATRQVSNALSQARQYAITQRVRTRVVFPYSGTLTVGTNQAPRYLSYSVMTNSAGGWGYLSKWEFLPVGVVFTQGAGVGALDNLSLELNVLFPNTINGSLDKLRFIEFTPTGAAAQNYTFLICEGHMDGGSPTPTGANNATATVDNVVGRIRITRP
jgi:Tfp pilus assembly protein FimT